MDRFKRKITVGHSDLCGASRHARVSCLENVHARGIVGGIVTPSGSLAGRARGRPRGGAAGLSLAPSVWRAGRTLSTRSPIFLTNARGGATSSAVHRLTVKPKGLWRLGRLDDSGGAGWRGGTVTVPFSNPQVFPLRCATSPVVTKAPERTPVLPPATPGAPTRRPRRDGLLLLAVSLFPHNAAVETRCPSQASVTRKCRGR